MNKFLNTLNSDTMTKSQKLTFNHCLLGMRITSGVSQFLVWTASVVLALKYQLVASSMEMYITGNLDSIRHKRLI